mmetsp:Transcript_33053/g.72070  ORF Transcript_33053/g.72070 Transcript_33053/m.72070 type:complete len:456 (-) Transcript_33053:40-1407(-)
MLAVIAIASAVGAAALATMAAIYWCLRRRTTINNAAVVGATARVQLNGAMKSKAELMQESCEMVVKGLFEGPTDRMKDQMLMRISKLTSNAPHTMRTRVKIDLFNDDEVSVPSTNTNSADPQTSDTMGSSAMGGVVYNDIFGCLSANDLSTGGETWKSFESPPQGNFRGSDGQLSLMMEGYTMERELGRGGFGSVFLARCTTTAQLVTVKVYNDPKNKQAIRESYFLDIMSNNPAVVGLRHALVTDSTLVIFMEFCAGGDISQFVRKYPGPVPALLVNKWVAELLIGVAHMHRVFIAHRDIKPANIFLTEDLDVRIGDLGLCRLMMDPSRTYVGSPVYMSPEQHQNQQYGLSGDIWALGCSIYEMCMKRPPFSSDTMEELHEKLAKGTVDPIPSDVYGADLPRVVAMMLNRDPRERPSAMALLGDPWVQVQVQQVASDLSSTIQARRSKDGLASH